jgi:hypothetical protein
MVFGKWYLGVVERTLNDDVSILTIQTAFVSGFLISNCAVNPESKSDDVSIDQYNPSTI